MTIELSDRPEEWPVVESKDLLRGDWAVLLHMGRHDDSRGMPCAPPWLGSAVAVADAVPPAVSHMSPRFSEIYSRPYEL